jgi:hypothetical protein
MKQDVLQLQHMNEEDKLECPLCWCFLKLARGRQINYYGLYDVRKKRFGLDL